MIFVNRLWKLLSKHDLTVSLSEPTHYHKPADSTTPNGIIMAKLILFLANMGYLVGKLIRDHVHGKVNIFKSIGIHDHDHIHERLFK